MCQNVTVGPYFSKRARRKRSQRASGRPVDVLMPRDRAAVANRDNLTCWNIHLAVWLGASSANPCPKSLAGGLIFWMDPIILGPYLIFSRSRWSSADGPGPGQGRSHDEVKEYFIFHRRCNCVSRSVVFSASPPPRLPPGINTRKDKRTRRSAGEYLQTAAVCLRLYLPQSDRVWTRCSCD